MSDLISRQAALISLEKSMNLNQMRERLKRLPSVQSELAKYSPKLDNENGELISRQMLLEYIHGEPVGRLLCDKYNLDGLIKQFPSAQPETHEKRTETHACDCISRQAAIDVCRAPHMRNADCSDFEDDEM